MFTQARIKLTIWYLAILMLVSILFSIAIFDLLSKEVERFSRMRIVRYQQRFLDRPVPYIDDVEDKNFVNEVKEKIVINLMLINGAILLISGGLAYFLAGKTLRPIRLMLEEQNRFISDASHELKTPLTSLKIAFEVFLRDKNRKIEDANSLVSESIEEVNRLQSLSESLLTLTQYNKPKIENKFEYFNMKPVMESAIVKIRPQADIKDITIENKIFDFKFSGIKDSILDLFVILLDNAIKYSRDKSVIKVESIKKDKYVTVKIIDQGIGIDSKDVPKIFDRFYRSDSSRERNNTKGYGLGLSIAKKIVDMHSINIRVVSVPEKGTTFLLKFHIS